MYIYDLDSLNLSSKITLSEHGIESISLSPKASVLGVVLSTGEAFLADCGSGYDKLQTLETSFEDYTLKNSGLLKKIKLVQDELERSTLFEGLKTTGNLSTIGAERRSKRINYQKYYIKAENAFKALTSHNSNTLQLQQIYRDDLTISSSSKITYYVEGKCTGFEIHPSNDYLLVTSNVGFLYTFKLVNGEIRLKISIPACASGLVLDPSGLYCVISAFFTPEEEKNGQNRGREFAIEKRVDLMKNNFKGKEKNRVLMLEIGTGQIVGELSHIFDITAGCFSAFGEFAIFGSSRGHVGVWRFNETLLKNIHEVLDQIRINPKFWNDYPIYVSSGFEDSRGRSLEMPLEEERNQNEGDLDSLSGEEEGLEPEISNKLAEDGQKDRMKIGARIVNNVTETARSRRRNPNYKQNRYFFLYKKKSKVL